MAFTPDTLGIIAQPISGTGIRVFSYVTSDGTSTVLGSGYFADVVKRGTRLGDLILCTSPTGATNFIGTVSTIDANGNATIIMADETSATVTIDISTGGVPATYTRSHSSAWSDGSNRDIQWFGFAGGTTDAYTPMLKGIQWTMENNGNLILPTAANYYLSQPIILDDYVPANVEASPVTFGIQGQHRRGSRIVVGDDNTIGAIDITFSGNNRHFNGNFSDFGIMAKLGVTGPKTGGGFRCQFTGSNTRQFRHVTMNRVDIWGDDKSKAAFTEYMCDLYGTFRPIVHDCHFIGANGLADPPQWEDTSPSFTCKVGLRVDECYAPNIRDIQQIGARVGYSHIAASSEGGHVHDCHFNNNLYSYRWIRSSHTAQAITGITQAAQGVVTYTGATPTNGDVCLLRDIGGMIQLNDRQVVFSDVTGSTFKMKDDEGSYIDTSGYTAYTSGGTFLIVDDVAGTYANSQPNCAMSNIEAHAREIPFDFAGIRYPDIRDIHPEISSRQAGTCFHATPYGVRIRSFLRGAMSDIQCDALVPQAIDIFLDGSRNGADFSLNNTKHFNAGAAALKVRGTAVCKANGTIIGAGYTKDIDDNSAGAATGNVYDYFAMGTNETRYMRHKAANGLRVMQHILYRDSASPANNDLLSALVFSGNNSSIAETQFAAIEGRIDDVTAATEDGGLNFYAALAGTPTLIWSYSGLALSYTVPTWNADGSAATPSISFVNDPDCGFWRQAANVVSLSLNGVEQWRASTTVLSYRSDRIVGWTAGIIGGNVMDTALSRSSAGVVKFEDGSGNLRDWTGRHGTLSGTLTFSAGGQIDVDSSTTIASGTGGTSTATLSKMAGVITTDAITTAAGATHVMTITNTLAATGDLVLLTRAGGTNTRHNFSLDAVTGASTITVTIANNEPANAINGTIIFNFVLLKA